ncbi:MAG: hypothetical protein U0236_16705 [Nitrospira sp.]
MDIHYDSFPKALLSTRLRAWVAAGVITVAPWLWPPLAVTQDLVIPGQQSLAGVDEIELVYTDSQPVPKIIVRGGQPTNSFVLSSYRPPEGRLDLFPWTAGAHPIGPCQSTHIQMGPPLHLHLGHTETPPCGVMWSLQTGDKSLDALSFRTLRLRGTTSHQLTIEFVDGVAGHHHSHAVVERITGPFALEIPLAPLAQNLDLRHLTQMRLLTETDADVVLDEVAFLGPASDSLPTPSVGFWYWDYHAAIRDPHEMVAACQKQRCRRILLQLPDIRDADEVWAAYAQLFAVTQSAQIELFALDGAPDMIDHATPLIEKLDRLLALLGSQGLPGVQLDIEPYLLDGFPDDHTILDRYVDTIDRIKTALERRTKLSMVIPFWFASTMHRDRPLAFSVMDRVDEVAVMSYRTNLDELLTISDDLLRYGALKQMPVWLALETTNLPPERHVILKREHRAALADGVLDPVRRTLTLDDPGHKEGLEQDQAIGFRIHHLTMVRPERISFSGRTEHEVRHTITDVFARIQHPSFSGLVIHDLPGYLALPH